MVRRRATVKAVYTLCEKVLDGKFPVEYTEYDKRLRYQRSVLRNCWCQYDVFISHRSDVQDWIKEYDAMGGYNKIVADTWRWILCMNKKLPVKIQKNR